MIFQFSSNAWDDFNYLLDREPKLAKKCRALLKEISRHPYEGTGNPEALKHQLSGFWSRRISLEHRIVYQVIGIEEEQPICFIVQCRNHY